MMDQVERGTDEEAQHEPRATEARDRLDTEYSGTIELASFPAPVTIQDRGQLSGLDRPGRRVGGHVDVRAHARTRVAFAPAHAIPGLSSLG